MAEDVSAALIEKMVRRRYAGFSEDKIAEKIREELDRAAGKEKPVERANSARTFKATRRDALADTLDELEWRADCLRSRMDAADPCWEGYEQRGTKEKDGRTVPNCVEADADTTSIIAEYQRLLKTEGAASRAVPSGKGLMGKPSEAQMNDPQHKRFVQAYEKANSALTAHYKQYKKEIDKAARDPATRAAWLQARKG